ncbi:MAG: hypothetical protein M4579_003671 [Chaenotheca gracillima]|nr:MAG: hypothetical protein M4579_003671 [Chaenotheca gracillima]
MQNAPAGAADLIGIGSTSRIWRHPTRNGVVIKSPSEPQDPSQKNKFSTEAHVLQKLGQHPRIVQYLGSAEPSEPTRDLLLIESVHGDLQQYLSSEGSSIDERLRLKWCKQAAEALAYCHARNVIHCDLRPDNMLINADLELSFCDFGGSKCGEYDGEGLPDYGFFDPRSDPLGVTEATEVFGLGSSLYTIMTGHLPHGPPILKTAQDRLDYAAKFNDLVLKGEFPDTSQIKGGDIISDCWTRKIESAQEVFSHYVELDARPG